MPLLPGIDLIQQVERLVDIEEDCCGSGSPKLVRVVGRLHIYETPSGLGPTINANYRKVRLSFFVADDGEPMLTHEGPCGLGQSQELTPEEWAGWRAEVSRLMA